MCNKQFAGGVTLLLIAFVCMVVSSGCGGNANAAALGSADGNPSIDEMQDFLYSEFERLGIDPTRQGSQAPSGEANQVFDLSATLIDPDGNGPEKATGIDLAWTEQLTGDYDQNGEVGMSDLTAIAINYGLEIGYDSADEHNGLLHWPTGDPDGSGSANWRMARIDGDGNGEINLADITSIAQHWGERLDGYTLYKNGPSDTEYSALPNGDNPESLLTISRSSTFRDGSNSPDPGKPVRYHYTIDLEGFGSYDFQLGSLDEIDEMEGSRSSTLSFVANEPPIADLVVTPDHGAAPLTVFFDASGSSDNDGEIVLYEWDFDGDGTFDGSTTEPTIEYTYGAVGTWEAVLQVTDNLGATDTATATVRVFDNPPIARLVASTTEGSAPLHVVLDASGSTDSEWSTLRFEWDLDGDGSFDDWTESYPVPAIVQNLYLEAGTITVSVKCINGNEEWDIASVDITIAPVDNGLYIAPDPADLDWLDVAGAGTGLDPYVLAVHDGYNSDLRVEFSMVAYEFAEGIWSEINVAELDWTSWPPFIVDWISPGIFMVNQFTSEYIFANRLNPEGVSNYIYVTAHILP